MTSMPACFYFNSIGLNDTIIFQADSINQNMVGMHVEMKDIKHLASLEKNPKKRRLMQERQFNSFAGNSILSKVFEGSRPLFASEEYDMMGMEQKMRRMNSAASGGAGSTGGSGEAEAQPEAEKSFIQKYWWQLIVGFILIQTLLGGAPEEGQGQKPAAGGK
mmetsp:Transcript_42280/g.64818  ORF Transcript_42280/g.64818 Transcript_42280/m.64818 type:complete len:162 (+) Transcript_42280:378-863(+)